MAIQQLGSRLCTSGVLQKLAAGMSMHEFQEIGRFVFKYYSIIVYNIVGDELLLNFGAKF